MTKALVALHFQNDICHRDGLIPFAIDRSSAEPDAFLERAQTALARAHAAGRLVVHVHIAFAPDYSDVPRNARLFLAAEKLGALKLGSWGAAAMAGFEPGPDDILLIHRANNAFHETGLQDALADAGVREIAVMGLATQYSVEHTVRHAADLGYAVTMIRDCCASANAAAAEASFAAMAMLAEIRTLDEMAF